MRETIRSRRRRLDAARTVLLALVLTAGIAQRYAYLVAQEHPESSPHLPRVAISVQLMLYLPKGNGGPLARTVGGTRG